jgi:hypothetical protein
MNDEMAEIGAPCYTKGLLIEDSIGLYASVQYRIVDTSVEPFSIKVTAI